MSDIEDLGGRAFAHVYALAAGIGPRPAGSEAETRAGDYALAQLRGWRYAPETTPVRFAPTPRLALAYASGGLALAAGGLLLTDAPWLALLAAPWIAALPDLARELIRRRPRTGTSCNVLAYTPGPESAPTLLLCAHLDSAPASAFGARPLLWLHQNLMFLALRAAWALAAVAALNWLGLPLPEIALSLVGGAALLIGGVWAGMEIVDQALRGARHSPGAHDNASGVGVLLAVAERLAAQPPARLRVGFLFTGAEETGLHGAEAAAEALRGRRAAVLNVDMAGAGAELRYVTQDGALRVRATDDGLNDLIRAAAPEARGLAYSLRSGDFLPFLRRGIPAGSLQTAGSTEAELAYHTVYDSVEVIEVEALGRTAQTVLKVIELAEARGYPERAA